MSFKDHRTTRLPDHETGGPLRVIPWSRGPVVPWSRGAAFTLVEMLVTLVLMSLIVLALMAVFNSTQQAFRSSLTQTDILESGRNVMGLMTADLETTAPSDGTNVPSLYFGIPFGGSVNFYANTNLHYVPLLQALPASPTGAQRTNVLEQFFSLSRQNVGGTPSWVGTGYAVNQASQPTNSLYRFFMHTNTVDGNPWALFSNYIFAVQFNTFTNTTYWSHLLDGVVDLRVRAFDPHGYQITNAYDVYDGRIIANQNTIVSGQNTIYMFSNTVPASVEVELGVLENATLQHVEGLPPGAAQLNYLSNHVGQVHLFRQRVWIRNVNPAAYQ